MGVLEALVCAWAFRIVESFALAVCKQIRIGIVRMRVPGRLTFNDHGRHLATLFGYRCPCRQRRASHGWAVKVRLNSDKAVLTKVSFRRRLKSRAIDIVTRDAPSRAVVWLCRKS